jgi:hypothetical protein
LNIATNKLFLINDFLGWFVVALALWFMGILLFNFLKDSTNSIALIFLGMIGYVIFLDWYLRD